MFVKRMPPVVVEAKAGSSTGSRTTEELWWENCFGITYGQGRAFHKAEPDIEKALDPVSVFIRGTTTLFEFLWSVDILSISAEQVSQPDIIPVGCLLGFGKLMRLFENACET